MQRRPKVNGKRDVQTVLFTAVFDDNVTADTEETEIALEMMERAIYTSLRRADISTRYSGKQIIVILMDANSENGVMVAERIIDCFNKLYTGKRVRFEFGIASV